MSEKKEDQVSKSSVPEEETSEAPPSTPKAVPESSDSSESFLGTMLIVVLVLLILGVTGFFGFVGYRIWRENQLMRTTPSIERIAVIEPAPSPEQAPVPETPALESPQAPSTPPAPTIDKAALEVKVLNGGAAKGSAGTLVEVLKKAGYAKAAYGNTVGDYAGTIIYFAEGKEAEGEALKADVIKTYPGVTTAKSIASNKDSTAASLVVILGK